MRARNPSAPTSPPMANTAHHPHDTRGSTREVRQLAWPTIVSMLSFTLMEVADTYFVGRLGVVELAAMGLSTMVVFVLHSFCFGLLGATRVVIAQLDGAERRELFSHGAGTTLLLALIVGALVMPLSLVSQPLFALLGGSAEVQQVAVEYFNTRLYGSWAFFVMIGLGNVLKGSGDMRTPMRINLGVNTLNIALDPVLIYGLGPIPAMRHIGAAHTSTIVLILGMLAMFWATRQRFRGSWRPQVALFTANLRYGIPMGVQWMLEGASWVVFMGLMARIGDAALAANTAVMRIISVSFLPGYGIAEAANVLAGRYTGAGEEALVPRVWRSAVLLGVILMGLCGVIFFIVPEPLIRIFSTDPEIVRIGALFLQIAAVFQVADALGIISSNTLTGTGDTRFTMWVALGSAWLIFVPVAWYLSQHTPLGAIGAWVGLVLHLCTQALVFGWRVHRGGWKGKSVVRATSPPPTDPPHDAPADASPR